MGRDLAIATIYPGELSNRLRALNQVSGRIESISTWRCGNEVVFLRSCILAPVVVDGDHRGTLERWARGRFIEAAYKPTPLEGLFNMTALPDPTSGPNSPVY